MTSLCQSLPESSRNRPRQRDLRTSTNGCLPDAVMKLSVLLGSVSWKKCLHLGKQRKQGDPLQKLREKEMPYFVHYCGLRESATDSALHLMGAWLPVLNAVWRHICFQVCVLFQGDFQQISAMEDPLTCANSKCLSGSWSEIRMRKVTLKWHRKW